MRRSGLGIALLLVFAACGGDTVVMTTQAVAASSAPTATTATTTEGPTETVAHPGEMPGEIFSEPAGSLGPDPFTGEVFTEPPVSTTAPIVTTTTLTTVTTQPGQVVVAGHSGDEQGLYGGTLDNARCDREGILAFLLVNPGLAAAWVAALNADQTLLWDEGQRSRLEVADLPAYFEELTPVTLLSDTRVTNHGFRDGRPTPRQSVLQAGTAVLVDRYGVPRARCACGNPLTPPLPSPAPPTYTGDRWDGFDTTIIIVIQPSTVIIDVLVLINVFTGEIFERPVGSAGDRDSGGELTDLGTEGVTAVQVSGTVPSSSGWAINAPYDTVTFTVDLDPAQLDWIAFSSLDGLEDRGTEANGQGPGDGISDILFGDVDDQLIVTASKDGVYAGIVLHDNDAMGTPIGNQAVIYGYHPSVWHVSAIDWSTDPPTSFVATSPETGELTNFINTEGAGTYQFEVIFMNLWTDRVAHGELYMLLGKAIS